MSNLGNFALLLAWVLTIVGAISGMLAGRSHKLSWFYTARNSTILVGVALLISLGSLAYAFLTSDFSNQYVWQFSNRDMEPIYKFTAIWGGMDGSMLLWATLLGGVTTLLAYLAPRHSPALMSWVLSVANTSTLFFVTVTLFFTNPFRYIKAPFVPPDGNGLNPLLQNPYMAIHPPTLYIGFTTLAVPFAFCIGALLAGHINNEWIRLTRRWTLIGWGFLTAGIVLGGHWAYLELGWGGFWAWDPVENASFLPWLTATAFLHSVMVQERKDMLKLWNIWLVTLTYGLTVFGTFLTRSGVVESVHAFASTDIGWIFLVYLALIFLVTAGLTWVNRTQLRSARKIESFFSRESAFLMNNLVFLGIAFATFWGTMFPVFSEALTGKKQSVSIPFFNAVNVPIFLLLIFLMGVGPLIAWRKASLKKIAEQFTAPFILAVIVGAFVMWGGIDGFYPTLSYALCAFVLFTILGELHRGVRAQRIASGGSLAPIKDTLTLFRRHTVRYGGYLIHFGVLVVTVAITASMAHKVERDFTLGINDTYSVNGYTLSLLALNEVQQQNYSALHAEVALSSPTGSGEPTVLKPELRLYSRNQETTSEVAIRSNLRNDVYLVLAGLDDAGSKATFKVYINPLQAWLWIGTLIMLAGTVIVILPKLRDPAAIRARQGSVETVQGT